jgi:hypothetical protein
VEPDILEMYWQSLKNYDSLENAFRGVIKNFISTSACPFPLIPHFAEQMDYREPKSIQHYKQPEIDPSELPDEEFRKKFYQEIKNMFKEKAGE